MTLGKKTPGKDVTAAQSSTFLSRLRRDQRGNALAIITAAIVPLVGAIGGGVDLTRAYMAEARLAQACDAGALAGRKLMTNAHVNSSGSVISGSTADTEIQKFIDYNFPEGKFNTGAITRTATVSDQGELTITLATAMPTQLLRIVGVQSMNLNAECSARRSGVNVDVVLVVDVTGSMSTALGGTTRLGALKSATLSFLDTLDDLRDQLASSGMRVRVGIVPYSQTVNIGHELYAENPDYIEARFAKYYSREHRPDLCRAGNNYCQSNNSSNNNRWSDKNLNNSSLYPEIGKITLNLSEFVSRGINDPDYTNPYNWKGCVEMRETIQSITSTTSLNSIPTNAWDIRDVAPGTDGAPKWQPYFHLPNRDLSYARYGAPTSGSATSDNTFKKISSEADRASRVPYRVRNSAATGPTLEYSQATSTAANGNGPNYNCSTRVRLLSEQTRDDLEDYVDSLTAVGNTYHDAGMYWGLALISPQAPFENANTYLASGFSGEERGVNRYIVFMTDGTLEPTTNYSAWGYETSPSDAGNNTVNSGGTANAHRRRFRMLCEEAKRTGIDVSTVAFSNGVGSTDETALQNCASSEDHYYQTDTASGLEEAFLKIAQNIGYLRVSK